MAPSDPGSDSDGERLMPEQLLPTSDYQQNNGSQGCEQRDPAGIGRLQRLPLGYGTEHDGLVKQRVQRVSDQLYSAGVQTDRQQGESERYGQHSPVARDRKSTRLNSSHRC